MYRTFFVVITGGFFGTLSRVLISAQVSTLAKASHWPVDIFIINITGAFVFAFLLTWTDKMPKWGLFLRIFLGTGFLGAYTTFSSYMLGTMQLIDLAHFLVAGFYLIGSIILGLIAAMAGRSVASVIRQ